MLQDSRCKQLDMMSFLVKPVQRVCKYPLLLRVSLFNIVQRGSIN